MDEFVDEEEEVGNSKNKESLWIWSWDEWEDSKSRALFIC